jgi:hydroxymethylglutaryl-CoA lyase
LVDATRALGPLDELGLHLHDTRGLALANAFAGMEAGIDRLDGTVGGLGGCPFAPGASGNLPLEDLVHVLEAMGQHTGIDLNRLLEASALACELTGSQPTSHVAVAGPRFAARS